jgi:hypothetical protein
MKYLVILILGLLTTTAWGSGVCEQMHKTDKPLLQKALDKKYSCHLEWTEKKKKKGAEVLLLHKYCIQMEGGYPEDCILGRTCAKSEKESDYGVPLYLRKDVLGYVCAAGDRYLLGNEGEKGEVAVYVKCHKGKIGHIELVSPSGKKKSCPFPN